MTGKTTIELSGLEGVTAPQWGPVEMTGKTGMDNQPGIILECRNGARSK